MGSVPPSQLQGDALARHLQELGMIVFGTGGLLYLTPSGKSLARKNPHVLPLVENHNRPILNGLIVRWLTAELLRFDKGKYHFTDRALKEFQLKKGAFSERRLYEHMLKRGKPPSMQRRDRRK